MENTSYGLTLWWAPPDDGETTCFTATGDRASSGQGKTLDSPKGKLNSERIHCILSPLGNNYIWCTSQITWAHLKMGSGFTI